MRSPRDFFTLAQMQGTIGSGPAAGLSSPMVFRLGQSVDLASGFILEVDGVSLFSAAAVDPAGHTVSTAFRYWMWDAPCVSWQTGGQSQMRVFKLDTDDERQGAHTDITLAGLTIDGAVLDPTFESGVYHYDVAVGHDTAQLTLQSTVSANGRPVYSEPDADPDTSGHQIALNAAQSGAEPAQTAVLITVNCTNTYTITVTRPPATRFGRNPSDSFAAVDLRDIGISWPRDIWSDGRTMWVANASYDTHWFPGIDGKFVDGVYAVDLATGTAIPERTLDFLAPDSVGFSFPTSMWSDGTTLWVMTRTGWVYRFTFDTLEQIESRGTSGPCCG